MIKLTTPISDSDILKLKPGDMVLLSGYIYTGRDAILPKLQKLIIGEALQKHGLDLTGKVIFHTAVSRAGVGPTSSNKVEIEGSFPLLSQAGVKLHLGKGAISRETISELQKNNSAFGVIPPVTALLESKTISKKVVAFPEDGMEAMHELEVVDYPIIIAAVNGKSIY